MSTINRNNYEEYFLLYTDDELSAAEKRAVEEFVEQHPDLKIELEMLQQSVLHAEPVVFHDKDVLLKNSSQLINETNYQEYFVLYGDDELNNEQKDSVEQFVYRNPAHQVEFELIQKARLQADRHVIFPDKTSLYRSEQDDEKVFVIRWWKIAAAAAVLIFLSGLGWYMISDQKTTPVIVKAVPKKDTKEAASEKSKQQPENIAQVDKEVAAPVTTNPAPFVVKSSERKETITKAPRVTSPVGTNEDKPTSERIAGVEKKATKEDKINNGSNIQIASTVTNKKADVSVDEMKPSNQMALENKKEIIDVAVGTPEPNPYAYTASNDEIEILNTTVSKKNKLRGLFRKVTRVVEKTTNIETDGKGIRIANFEIALK
jgi:hypothetical protein